jgi:hypothetical protein
VETNGSVITQYSASCTALCAEECTKEALSAANVIIINHHSITRSQETVESKWSEQEVQDLLEVCKTAGDFGGDAITKNSQKWNLIGEKMNEKGYKKSKEMCKNKFTKLKKEYMNFCSLKIKPSTESHISDTRKVCISF